MLCKVCVEGLQGIWDPSKTKRVCRMDEFEEEEVPIEDSRFVTIETYKTVKPYDPEFLRPEHYMFGHHLTKESFQESVCDGCVMCHSFQPLYEGQESKEDPKITALGYYSLFSVEFEDCPFMYMYVNDHRGGFELSRQIIPHDNMNLNISPSTGDDTTWRIIQNWLNTCHQGHDRCNAKPLTPFAPARLLQLEISTTQELNFRVVHASEIGPDTRYVTLSHCYGDEDDGLQLTESTAAQLSTPQPLSILPATFRDAFAVVVRLGLTHLWIDRLCTFQDNPSDQRDEARKRRDIFQNSFLSIAASATASSSSGLFSTRDPARVQTTVFEFPVGDVGTTVPYRSSLEMPRGWMHAFGETPLAKSAHAVQERLFAPRVVHYGRKMVFWECHEASCAEIHPRGVNISLDDLGGQDGEDGGEENNGQIRRRDRPWKALLNASSWRYGDDPVHQLFSDWFGILEMYTGCSLKAPEEQLHGMAAVAEDMKRLLRERGCEETGYLAGMWKIMLPGGLLWNVREPGSRPTTYRAPSWSWAAVDGKVNFHQHTPAEDADGLLCKLVSAATTPCTTAHGTGEATTGSIVLRGKLAVGKLYPVIQSLSLPQNMALIQGLVVMDGDTILAEPVPTSPSGYNCRWNVLFDTTQDRRDEILCFPMRVSKFADICFEVYGLALAQLDDGCYVRRGMWTVMVDTEEEALEIFKGLPERQLEIV